MSIIYIGLMIGGYMLAMEILVLLEQQYYNWKGKRR